MKYIIQILFFLLLISCNKEKLNRLEKEVKELKIEIDLKDSTIKRQNEELHKKKMVKHYSNSKIIQIVKSDRQYYCPNKKRKNFVVRQINVNVYDVRFMSMTTDKFRLPKIWEVTVYRIKFLPEDKYSIHWKKGPMCI